jgi:hypothetical protein
MNFQETYAAISNDELLLIASSRTDLVQEAALAMDSEMARRGLSIQDAQAKKRDLARLEIKEARKRRSSPKGNKYFVAQIRGRWLLLLLSPTLLIILFVSPHSVGGMVTPNYLCVIRRRQRDIGGPAMAKADKKFLVFSPRRVHRAATCRAPYQRKSGTAVTK